MDIILSKQNEISQKTVHCCEILCPNIINSGSADRAEKPRRCNRIDSKTELERVFLRHTSMARNASSNWVVGTSTEPKKNISTPKNCVFF